MRLHPRAWTVMLASAAVLCAAAATRSWSASPPAPALAPGRALAPEALALGRAAMEQSLGRPHGVIRSLEGIDFSGDPAFAGADRAAFLLGQAYLQVGATERFVALTVATSGWRRQSVFTRWLAYQRRLAESQGITAWSDSVVGDSAVSRLPAIALGAADAVAASLRLREGDRAGALRLLSSAEARAGAPALAGYLEALALAAGGEYDDEALTRLSVADTVTALGRDLAGAAIVRRATRALERGEDPRPLLETVPPGSRYEGRARHMRGLAAMERGEVEQGRRTLDSLWATDSSYAARREAGLAIAGRDLDAGAWTEARRRYEDIDRDWSANREALRQVLDQGRAEELWASWESSATLSDAWILDALPSWLLAGRLASASADLDSIPAAEAPGLAVRPAGPGFRWPVAPPPAEDWDAVGAAAARAADATYQRDRARLDRDAEAKRLGDLRRYLTFGLGRIRRETESLAAWAARLDSMDQALQGVDQRLRAVRDEALRRVARRSAEVVAMAEGNRLWVDALRRFHVEGPNLGFSVPMGAISPDSLTREERALADSARGFALRLAAGAPDLIERSYQHAWRPKLIDVSATNRDEAHRLLARARTLAPAVDAQIAAAASSDTLKAIEWRLAGLERSREALEAEHRTLRAAVARRAVERGLAALDPEREAIDYGLAVAAYGASVRLAPPATVDSVLAAGEAAPSDSTAAAETDDRDDPEAAAWRARAIAEMKSFLARHPASPARGEMRFRLADLSLVKARQSFRDNMARFMSDPAQGGGAGPLPVLDQAEALALYRLMLEEDRDFPQMDAVLFNAGMLLADDGDPEAQDFFARLVTDHPQSRYVQEAYLRMGDLHFNEKRFAESVPLYQRAAEGDDPSLQAIALYKMGWAHFNGERLSDAADAFRAVLDVYESGRRPRINVDIQGEAESYLVHTLARSGGAQAFAEHFDRAGARPYERRVLRGLSHHFRRYSLFAEAAATEELYLERYPLDPDALVAAERLPETYQRWDRPALARQARLEVAPRFAPASAWAKAQSSDSVRTAGALFARAAWTSVALEHHQAARAGGSKDDWREASRLYRLLLTHWPDDADAPAYQLAAGEASAQLAEYPAALEHFQAAARSGRDGVAREAMFQEVAATDAWYESTRANAGPEGVGRDSLAKAVLTAGDRLIERFPQHSAAGEVAWRQGNLSLAHGWHERASQDFARFVAGHPDDPRAPAAAALDADARFRGGDFEGAGAAYEIAAQVAKRAGRDSLERAALAAIPVSYFRHAESVVKSEPSDHARHAALFEKVAKGWPAYEHAHVAQYKAGLAWLEAGKRTEGVAAMEGLIRDFPKSEYAKDAHLHVAKTWEAAGEREQAADAYAAFAKAYPDDENAAPAWLKAGDLLEAAGKIERADEVRLAYVARYPNDVEAAMEIFEGMARREIATVGPDRPISALLPAAPVAAAATQGGKKGAKSAKAPAKTTAPAAPKSRLAEYLARAEARPDLAARDLLAQVRYLQAEEARVAYLAARLTQPLDQSIPVKQKLLDAVIARYRECVDLGAGEWASASAFRIGEALVAFGEALEKSERPADLSGDDLRGYEDVLAEQSQPFYDRGEGVWADLLRKRGQEADKDPWVAKAQTSLWQRLAGRFYYRPETDFPLVEGERPERVRPAKTASGTGSEQAEAKPTQRAQREDDQP